MAGAFYRASMPDLFDAEAMYGEDYLHFFTAPRGVTTFAAHGPALPGVGSSANTAADVVWELPDLQQRRGIGRTSPTHPHAQRIAFLAIRRRRP